MLKMVSVFVHSVLLALKPIQILGQLHALHVLLAHTTTIACPTQRAKTVLLALKPIHLRMLGQLHALHVLLAHTTTIACPTQRAVSALLVPSQGPENRVALTALLVKLTLQQADLALPALLANTMIAPKRVQHVLLVITRLQRALHALHVLLAHTTTIAIPTQLAKHALVRVMKRKLGALHALHVLLAHTTTMACPTQRAKIVLLVNHQGSEHRVALTALLVKNQ